MIIDDEAERVSSFEEIVTGDLPESIAKPILLKNQEILGRFDVDQNRRPNIVFILERSGVLPSLKVTGQILKKYPETKIVHLAVGKILPYMFAEMKTEADDDFDEMELDLSNPSQAAEFVVWLKNTEDPTIRKLLQQVGKLNLRGKNILVLDDAQASGETIEFTLPLLIRAAYTREITFKTEIYFSGNFSWEKAVIQELGMELQPSEVRLISSIIKGSLDIRRFKIELESGFYIISEKELADFRAIIENSYKDGAAFLPLNSALTIKMAGYQALFQVNARRQTDEKNNPAVGLLNKYGLDNLLKMSRQVKEKFLEI